MSTEKATFPFTDKTKITLPAVAMFTVLTVVAGAAIVWGGDHKDVGAHSQQLAEHEQRIIRNAAVIAEQRNTLSRNAGQIADLARKTDALEVKIASDHDILLEIRADVKALNRERNRNP